MQSGSRDSLEDVAVACKAGSSPIFGIGAHEFSLNASDEAQFPCRHALNIHTPELSAPATKQSALCELKDGSRCAAPEWLIELFSATMNQKSCVREYIYVRIERATLRATQCTLLIIMLLCWYSSQGFIRAPQRRISVVEFIALERSITRQHAGSYYCVKSCGAALLWRNEPRARRTSFNCTTAGGTD